MNQLQQTDPKIANLLTLEAHDQASMLRMIPSENYASLAVIQAIGSCLTNKYSEGYSHCRYYQGQKYIDKIEEIAINRAKKLFGAEHVNVQPYSGTPANMAVYLALANPGDKILGMDLAAGGHLTHGAKISFSGKFFNAFYYSVNPTTKLLDYEYIRKLAKQIRPKIIIAGASSYPRIINFKFFRQIADEIQAYLVADISHISGLCISGDHPHPLPYADVITTTTHKILRGPRAGIILCRSELATKIDKAVFPTIQGGPHNNTTAAIAVALKEANTRKFYTYCHQIVNNAKTLAQGLQDNGFKLVTDGTDNHLILIDTTNFKHTAKYLAQKLELAGIITNYNKIPFDPRPAENPSGIRLGTPALTSRGMREQEMAWIAKKIAIAVNKASKIHILKQIRQEINELCNSFPAPGIVE